MNCVTLVLSVATNIGLLFYIIVNHQLEKWEKQSAARNIHSRILYQCNPVLPIETVKPEGD